MIKKEQRTDSLDVKFEGAFRVLKRRGAIVQVLLDNGKKWVHLNRCKEYERGPPGIIIPMEADERKIEENEDKKESEACVGIEETGVREVEVEATGSAEDSVERTEDVGEAEAWRYPRRNRKQMA